MGIGLIMYLKMPILKGDIVTDSVLVVLIMLHRSIERNLIIISFI